MTYYCMVVRGKENFIQEFFKVSTCVILYIEFSDWWDSQDDGAKAGVVIGGIAGIFILFIALVICCYKYCRKYKISSRRQM